MIEFKEGCLFSTNCQTIVNTVNTVGVMGTGLALVFKAMFPKMFQEYRYYCRSEMFGVGKLWLYKNTNRWQVLNFPTKTHWKNYSELPIIEASLYNLLATYKDRGITSLAIPMLGCQKGGLRSKQVFPLMKKYLDQLDIPVELWTNNKKHVNPIWAELYAACRDADSPFKRLVLSCRDFEDLSKKVGDRKDVFGVEVNRIIRFEP